MPPGRNGELRSLLARCQRGFRGVVGAVSQMRNLHSFDCGCQILGQIYCVVQPLVFQWLLSKLRRGIEGDGVVTS